MIIRTYSLNTAQISRCENVTDVGTVFSNNLRWSNYIYKIPPKPTQFRYEVSRARIYIYSYKLQLYVNIRLVVHIFNKNLKTDIIVKPTRFKNTKYSNLFLLKTIRNKSENIKSLSHALIGYVRMNEVKTK